MESQQSVNTLPAASVADAFVRQYYAALNICPDVLHKFYHESSTITRPKPNGQMTSVKTIQAIEAMMMSFYNKETKAEIMAVDSQECPNHTYIVMVNGVITGRDNLARKFAQSFFLAPQQRGFFVLNDIFQYLDNTRTVTLEAEPTLAQSSESEVEEQDTQAVKNEIQADIVEVHGTQAVQNEVQADTVEVPVLSSEETTKKSFLSALLKGNSKGIQPATVVTKFPISVGPKGNSQAPSQSSGMPSKAREAPDGCSIFIRNLPFNATTTLLGQEFKKFGPIRQGGIEVRSTKQQQSCYGFVEFESSSSVKNALKASPITIFGRKVYIEEKRAGYVTKN